MDSRTESSETTFSILIENGKFVDADSKMEYDIEQMTY